MRTRVRQKPPHISSLDDRAWGVEPSHHRCQGVWVNTRSEEGTFGRCEELQSLANSCP